MDSLIRVSLVTLRRLASVQEREERFVEVERHEFCHCQHRVLHDESARQRVSRVLMAMTREMQNGRIRELFQDSADCRRRRRLDLDAVDVAKEFDWNLRWYGSPHLFNLAGHIG